MNDYVNKKNMYVRATENLHEIMETLLHPQTVRCGVLFGSRY